MALEEDAAVDVGHCSTCQRRQEFQKGEQVEASTVASVEEEGTSVGVAIVNPILPEILCIRPDIFGPTYVLWKASATVFYSSPTAGWLSQMAVVEVLGHRANMSILSHHAMPGPGQ